MGSIYDLCPTEGTEWCNPATDEASEFFRTGFTGASLRDTWKPVPMKMVQKTVRRKMRYADAPWRSSSSPVFRKSAVEKMRPILDEYGELLPLECPDAELWVFNATNILDAFDEETSVYSRSITGQIYLIDKYVFRPHVVDGIDMFKVASWRAGPTFVSDRFVDLWNASGLKGLKFDKLWAAP